MAHIVIAGPNGRFYSTVFPTVLFHGFIHRFYPTVLFIGFIRRFFSTVLFDGFARLRRVAV